MKRILSSLFALLIFASIFACKKGLSNGKYNIEVESSSSMFNIVNCVLDIAGDKMTADMTMSGQGYGYLFMGTSENAPAEPNDENAIPFTLDAVGAKVFTIPVSALDTEIDCAAWSIKKQEWYDRKLTFKSDTAKQAKTYASGSYTCEVTLSGGTGRASIESPASIEIKDGAATAVIVWSSSHYQYMTIGETQYDPTNADGNSTFEIPVVFDTEIQVSALTDAMSEPHLIEYTLYFDSSTLKNK